MLKSQSTFCSVSNVATWGGGGGGGGEAGVVVFYKNGGISARTKVRIALTLCVPAFCYRFVRTFFTQWHYNCSSKQFLHENKEPILDYKDGLQLVLPGGGGGGGVQQD